MRVLGGVICGFGLDRLLGDRSWMPHPVVWMGRVIGGAERFLRPRLPATPRGELFGGLLLALFLFARSSPRWRIALMKHRLLGPYIRGYASNEGLSVRTKATTLAVMWAAMLFSVVFIVRTPWLRTLLLAIAVGVSVHILLKKTRRSGRS